MRPRGRQRALESTRSQTMAKASSGVAVGTNPATMNTLSPGRRGPPGCVASPRVTGVAATHRATPPRPAESYACWVLDLAVIDVEEIATALADQTDYEHRWLIDPATGEVVFWTSDTGIDGENPVELDELELIVIDPLPSYVWYQDMVDFADGISDRATGRRLSDSLQGRGVFRRFKNELFQHHPELISAWHAMRDARARVRAVDWLVDEGLIEEVAAQRFKDDQIEPTLP